MTDRPLPFLQPDYWLIKRLSKYTKFDRRFEGDLRSLYVVLLTHYFPPYQNYMAAMLFMSGPIMPTKSNSVPDVVVAKVITGFSADDLPRLLVKLIARTRDDPEPDLGSYTHQLRRAIISAARQVPKDGKLAGLLVCGTQMIIGRLEGPGLVRVDEVTHDFNSETVREFLLDLARD